MLVFQIAKAVPESLLIRVMLVARAKTQPPKMPFKIAAALSVRETAAPAPTTPRDGRATHILNDTTPGTVGSVQTISAVMCRTSVLLVITTTVEMPITERPPIRLVLTARIHAHPQAVHEIPGQRKMIKNAISRMRPILIVVLVTARARTQPPKIFFQIAATRVRALPVRETAAPAPTTPRDGRATHILNDTTPGTVGDTWVIKNTTLKNAMAVVVLVIEVLVTIVTTNRIIPTAGTHTRAIEVREATVLNCTQMLPR